MYEAFYEMKQTPFVRNIPSEELYESPAMAEAFARLNYAADRQLFAVLTSDAGCGKSTLIRRFNDNLPKDKYLLLYVSDSKLTPKWLYKSLLDQLGLEAGFYRGDAKRLLQKQIEIIRTKEHRKVVCVLDCRNTAENRYYLHSSASGSVSDTDVYRFQSALCRSQ